VLALDDTHDPRNGNAIEGAGLHHDAQQWIQGMCAVTALPKLGKRRFCFARRGYRPKAHCPQHAFRSQIDLACDILKEASAHFGRGQWVVLADGWYGCVRLLTDIHARGWTYGFGIQSNRLVRFNGKKRRVPDLAKARHKFRTLKLGGRKLRLARVVVKLPRLGEVVLLMSRCGKEWRCFVSNDVKLEATTLARLYAHRWGVDLMHREMKQPLGLGEVFARRWQATPMHWTLVMVAYNVVEMSSGAARESFRAQQRAVRDAITPAELIRHDRRHA
jgi:SRSO17 transposase